MKFYFFFLVSLSLLFLGCSKAKSGRWMVADVTVLDYYTHEPITFEAKMSYTQDNYIGQVSTETINLGASDDNGNIKIEERVRRRDSGYALLIYAYGNYILPDTPEEYSAHTVELSEVGENKKTIYLKPFHFYKIHMNNQNCSGVEDSIWITNTYNPYGLINQPVLYVGCQNDIYPNTNTYSYCGYTDKETVEYTIKVKKAGVTTTSNQVFNLVAGYNNLLEIDY